jgi:hypothetical protein
MMHATKMVFIHTDISGRSWYLRFYLLSFFINIIYNFNVS